MNESERKEYLTQFGSRVKELRKNKGMTQLELAVKAGYTDGAKVTGFEPVIIYRLKPRKINIFKRLSRFLCLAP